MSCLALSFICIVSHCPFIRNWRVVLCMSSVSHHLSGRHRTVLIRVQLTSLCRFLFLLRRSGQYYLPGIPGSWKTTHLVCALLSTLTTCLFLTLYLSFVVMGASTVLELHSIVFFIIHFYFLLLSSKIVLVIWPTLNNEEIGIQLCFEKPLTRCSQNTDHIHEVSWIVTEQVQN